MFIDWEKRHAFLDTLDAMGWQRAASDVNRIVDLWVHQFASEHDPVQVPASKLPVR